MLKFRNYINVGRPKNCGSSPSWVSFSFIEDHLFFFLQTFPALSTTCGSPDLPPGASVYPHDSMEAASQFIDALKKKVEDLLKNSWPNFTARGKWGLYKNLDIFFNFCLDCLSQGGVKLRIFSFFFLVSAVNVVLPPVPETREQFLLCK